MGLVGHRVASLGGRVHGIKPRPFLKYEPTGQLPTLGTNELVDDLHTQKRRIASMVDAFIFLPGRFGTLEELVAVRMWSKLGEFNAIFLEFEVEVVLQGSVSGHWSCSITKVF
jgi:predicted Rossmann-fold nucleotide-binding protein